jgi:molybdopterin converting factor subunit 1
MYRSPGKQKSYSTICFGVDGVKGFRLAYPVSMRIRVLYFGVLKDIFGRSGAEMELEEGASVAKLVEVHRGLAGASVWDSIAVAVNQEYARAADVLKDGDEVALLPPVSGGIGGREASRGDIDLPRAAEGKAGLAGSNDMRVEITDGVIPVAEIAAGIKAGADGAVCVFDGIVRDNSRGRKTLYLDYEAYREMALEQMRGLAAEAVTKFGVRDVAMVHRLGRLRVGESSVLIVVASAHRGAAFDACRWLIDTLKKTVPIWKKEQFVDGAIWADGEAFPGDIGLPRASGVEAQSADGAPGSVGSGGLRDGRGGESGRPSDDTPISESRYGAPGSVGKERLGAGK